MARPELRRPSQAWTTYPDAIRYATAYARKTHT